MNFLLFSIFGFCLSLVSELQEMVQRDQTARKEGFSWEEIQRIDATHLKRLKEIIEEHGWPGFELVGEEGADFAWLLVQHCDADLLFQKNCLELLKEAVQKGDASKRHLAYLTDRVLVHEGKEQIYGTQVQILDEGAVPRSICNPDCLDERRAEMGLYRT